MRLEKHNIKWRLEDIFISPLRQRPQYSEASSHFLKTKPCVYKEVGFSFFFFFFALLSFRLLFSIYGAHCHHQPSAFTVSTDDAAINKKKRPISGMQPFLLIRWQFNMLVSDLNDTQSLSLLLTSSDLAWVFIASLSWRKSKLKTVSSGGKLNMRVRNACFAPSSKIMMVNVSKFHFHSFPH